MNRSGFTPWRVVLAALLVLAALAEPVSAAEVGQPAPPLEGLSLQQGAPVRLSDYSGQVVYLDFWASWCGPCQQSLPLLDALRLQFKDQGFEVLAVNVDEDSRQALNFLKKYPVSYKHVADPSGQWARLYDVKAMPSSYLIDRHGRVRMVHLGFQKKDLPELRSMIKLLLEES